MTFPLRMSLRCSTAAIALILPMGALAQSVYELGEINVAAPGENPTGPVAGQTDPATLTGAKSATVLSEIPQSVSVIGAAEIADFNYTQANEALRYSAGVLAQPFGDDSDTNWTYIRGFQSTATGTYLDGLQNFSYAFGGFYIDPYTLERIEVLRGPSSVLYGGSNPGGLINYVSKVPRGRVRETVLGLDDAGTGWLNFDLGDGSDDLGWRLTGRIEGGDKHDEFADGTRGIIAPSVALTTDGGTEITLLGNYTRIDEQHSGGSFLPYVGTAERAEFGYIDVDANFSEPDLDDYSRDQWHVGAIVSHDFGSWTISETARIGRSHVTESYLYPFGYLGFTQEPQDADNSLQRIFFQHDTTVETALSDTRIETKAITGAVEHSLLFGFDVKYYQIDQTQGSVAFPDMATPISATNPRYGANQPDTTPYIDQKLDQLQVGLYAQDQLRWGEGWIGTLNLRIDQVETEADENRATGVDGYNRTDTETSWRVGLARELANGITPYASASSYFNPEIVGDAAGNALSPETGEQYEVGLKYLPDDGRTSFTVSAFDIRRSNVLNQQFNPTLGITEYFQIGKVSSRGIEVEGSHDFGNGFSVLGSATQLDLTIDKDLNESIEGNTPYLVPEQQAALALRYAFDGALEGLRIGAGARYQGESWADNENTQKVPDATLYDATLGYAWNGWDANLVVSNIGDKRFVSGCQGTLVCSYGEGREVSATLTRTW